MERQLIRSEKLSSLGELASGVAHEVRNPLNAIRGFSELLKERFKDDESTRSYTEIIVEEVDRLDKIIKNVLDFAKESKMELKDIDINQVISDALKLISNKAIKGKINISEELKDNLPLISGDAQQLKQVFLNMFINAIQAMPNGGTLLVRTKVKDSSLRVLSPQYIQIEIVDTGVGIPPENLNKIFRPFYTTKANGTGLGLSISAKIIEAHHGIINVESKVGEGTTFIISLPIRQEDKGEI